MIKARYNKEENIINVERPDEIYSFKFQNRLLAFMSISEEKDDIYHRALRVIDIISELIEKELHE